MPALTDYLSMGGHAAFIWPAYGVAVVVLFALVKVSLRTLKANEIRETRGAQQRVGVHVGEETKDVKLIDNKIEGFKTPVVREKK